MGVISICNEKGGTGKSSIAQTLSVWLQQSGKTVLLVDTDPQRTTTDWAAERNESDIYPSITLVEMSGNIQENLRQLADKFDAIVVDCGGADSRAMRSALTVSSLAILPFRPKRRDLKVAPEMSEIIETAKAFNTELRVYSVITQAPVSPNQRYRIEGARELLASLGLNPLRNFTRNLNAWDDSEEAGCSVLEYTDDKKAGEDARKVLAEIFEEARRG